jgi:hypothetical protein
MTTTRKSATKIISSISGFLALIVYAVVASLGCGDRNEEIRSYAVAKETPPPAPLPPTQLTTPTGARGTMQWDLPGGWAQIANPNTMRFATLSAGEGAERIEVAITQLAGAAGGIAANINRWRGQVGLSAASESELAHSAREIRATGALGVMVDLVGPEGSDGTTIRMFAAIFPTDTQTWFVKTTGPGAVLEQHGDAFVVLCESVRFADSAGTASAATVPPAMPAESRASVTWDPPPVGWTVDASPAAMSAASFTISDGSQAASLTITPLGGTQDLLANINRWRRQVGLGPLSDLAESPPVPFEVDGRPGSLVDIVGTERRTLAVISTRGATTWFYKLSGPTRLVADQRSAFEAFLSTIRLPGAPHE